MLRKLLALSLFALTVGRAEGVKFRCFSHSTSSNPDINNGKWYLKGTGGEIGWWLYEFVYNKRGSFGCCSADRVSTYFLL